MRLYASGTQRLNNNKPNKYQCLHFTYCSSEAKHITRNEIENTQVEILAFAELFSVVVFDINIIITSFIESPNMLKNDMLKCVSVDFNLW